MKIRAWFWLLRNCDCRDCRRWRRIALWSLVGAVLVAVMTINLIQVLT